MKASILVAPLDWGLGHATRCIPIIRHLQIKGHEVIVGSSGTALQVIQREFPSLAIIEFPSYGPSYPRRVPFMLAVFAQLPRFLRVIRHEHRLCEKLVWEGRVSHIISDNRYGAWSAMVPSVIITHQLRIRMPTLLKWVQPLVNMFNHRMIRRFDTCWVPDFSNRLLSGELSLAPRLKVEWVGPLTRLSRTISNKEYDWVAVLSGPEPQRTALEKKVRQQAVGFNGRYLIVQGLPANQPVEADDHMVAFLESKELASLLARAHVVIARSGYSTVMDLTAIGAKAVFVPTPGQTEQEYLADRLMKAGVAYHETQDSFKLLRCLEKSKSYRGFEETVADSNLLAKAVENFLKPS